MAQVAAQLPLILDSPLMDPIKGERNVMAYPWFDLDSRAQKKQITFEDADVGVRIEVGAGNNVGCPTIFDKDLILYCASIIAARADAEQLTDTDADRTIRLTIHDFLRVAGRHVDDSAYKNFHAMLKRLTTAQISTNIEIAVGDGEIEGLDGWFTWFESGTAIKYRQGQDGKKRVQQVQVVVGKWLFNAIVKDRKILTYNPRYFDLGPVERRLYDLARVHVGHQDRWQIRLPKLQRRVGDQRAATKFCDLLMEIQQRDPLPEYRFAVIAPQRPGAKRRSRRDIESTLVVFTPKERAPVPKDDAKARTGGAVIELPAREIRHPVLVRHLEALGFTGCLGRAKAVNRKLREEGREVVLDRELAQDPVRLAELLVELGEERAG